MMKQISTRLLTVLGLCMFFLSACNNSSDFTVKGVVAGADGQLMYLENVGISNVVTLDSIKLAPGGKFKFTEKRPEYPDFYRLRLNNQLINFAVDSTETISFVADAGTFATCYSVEGSENSKAIKAITLAQLDANQAISRLRKEYEDKMISDTTYRMKVLAAADAYKEVARKYIYSAPMSTAAYFALFQQIDGLLFFDLYDRKEGIWGGCDQLQSYLSGKSAFEAFVQSDIAIHEGLACATSCRLQQCGNKRNFIP